MRNAKDKRIVVFYTVHNHVFAHSQTAVPWAEIFFAGAPDIGELGERKETIDDCIN